jgi:hypothetical protein
MKFTMIALLALFISVQDQAWAAADCARMEAAISATEDFAEAALDGTGPDQEKALASVQRSFAAVKARLPAGTVAEVGKAIAGMEGMGKGGAALAAVEAYRLLVVARGADDVAMLDHAGFKLRALAAGTDWDAMAQTVRETPKIKADGALADLMGHIHAGLKRAIAGRNAAWVDAEALILLDSVDLIEAKQPARACK